MRLPDLEGWAFFAKVAETGSFVNAADELGVSSATVSKVIQRLERRVGERLIHRSSRRFALTETGRVLAVRAAQIVAEGEAVEAAAQAASAAPHGRVRLAAPMSFGLRHLAPILPAFLKIYPGISVELQLDDRIVDLVAGGVDLALRIADMPDSSLVARRLCAVERWVVGHRDYFERRGVPLRPEDLKHHDCLGYSNLSSGETWRFTGPDGIQEAVAVRGRLMANNGDALQAALEAGLGVALQPDFLAWEAVRDGKLTTVMHGWAPGPLSLSLVTTAGGQRAQRVAVLMAFLIKHFGGASAPWKADFG
jgi:DNA-binding transcriptional LysR family regulator